MGYKDDEGHDGNARWSLKRIGGIFAGLVAFVMVRELTRDGIHLIQQKTVSDVDMEQRLEGDPNFSSGFRELKADFPDDYHRMASQMASMIRNGASSDELRQAGFTSMRGFVTNHAAQIISASDNTLADIAHAQANVANGLSSENQHSCADFGFDGLRPDSEVGQSTIGDVAEITRLMIHAAHEGTVNPTRRQTQSLQDADAEAFVTALIQRGITKDQLGLLDSEDAIQRASVFDKCKLTVAIYGSVAEMPTGRSARVTAYMLAQAAAARRQPAT